MDEKDNYKVKKEIKMEIVDESGRDEKKGERVYRCKIYFNH